MFFGAGNLIFPPFFGYEAGANTVPAFIGFSLTAVVCPVLGVAAVAKVGGLERLFDRVHPKLGLVFAVIVNLCIGPMLAIPRTAGTSYSMFSFLTDRLGEGTVLGMNVQILARTLFSLVFFLAAGTIAKKPEKLRELLGKKLTPILLVLILAMFGASLLHPGLPMAETVEKYQSGALMKGFVDGYQTMDTMAALVFGIIIAMNLRDMGIDDGNTIARETIRAGVIAGVFLIIIYGMLAYLGVISGSLVSGAENGTDILTAVCLRFFGAGGAVLLAAIFFIACFNVCVGLISSCSEFFAMRIGLMSFDNWRRLLTVWSFGISIIGLNTILAISVPILSLVYPVAIAIIVVNLLPFAVFEKKLTQRIVLAISLVYGIISVVSA